MSAQSGPDVAGLLADTHRWLGGGPICAFGWRRVWNGKRDEYIQLATHLDQVIREAYADWLESSEVREIVARTSYEHPGPEGQARWSWDDKRVWNDTREVWRSDAGASLAALADLLRGQA